MQDPLILWAGPTGCVPRYPQAGRGIGRDTEPQHRVIPLAQLCPLINDYVSALLY